MNFKTLSLNPDTLCAHVSNNLDKLVAVYTCLKMYFKKAV